MTPGRIKVLLAFLFKNRNNVTASDMLQFFFAPSYTTKSNRHITRIEEGKEFNKVYFKGYEDPLYYPTSFPDRSLRQVVVESFYKDNWHYYEKPGTEVRADDIVVDCGAAEGLFSFLIHKRCKKVYQIEPVAKFCESLRMTFKDSPSAEVVPVALSNQTGSAKISEHDISSSVVMNAEGGDGIQVSTLDKLFFEKGIPVSYIKIDLEGYDVMALEGARELIRKYKPRIAATTYHAVEHAEQMTSLLKSLVPEYNIRIIGILPETGAPVMLHAFLP